MLVFFPLAPLQRDSAILLPNPALGPPMDGGFYTENSPRSGGCIGVNIKGAKCPPGAGACTPQNCSDEELQIRPLADASLSQGLISPGAYDCISRCI